MNLLLSLIVLSLLYTPVYAQEESVDGSNESNQIPGTSPLDNASVWSQFAGGPRHQSRYQPTTMAPGLTNLRWIGSGDGQTTYIPIAQSGLVVDRTRVYAIATNPAAPGSNFVVAYNRITGEFEWATPLAPPILNSWSMPAIDVQHKQLIIAISGSLIALNSATGSQIWSSDLDGIVVNASPIVTSDLGNQDRAFITNYSFGGGNASKLTCINIDPFNAIDNPYQPGDIVWQTLLNAESSGNTPAYSNGVVYVASASSPGSFAGQIQAFDATSSDAPAPIWTFTNTINAGFYSGVSIARGHVYASSFAFNGLQFNSNTVKLNKLSGQLVWSVPTNRTDTTPIVLSNSDVVVSGGIAPGSLPFLPFFGSLPSIEYIQNNGSSATLLWDTALETLDDANANGIWDFGESFLSLGGWTHQPITLDLNATPMLLVGTLAETTPIAQFNHNTDLSLIDLTKAPTDPGFISEHFAGTGSTPAVVGAWIYAPGAQGIHAFAPPIPPVLTFNQYLHLYIDGQMTLNQLRDKLEQR